MVVTSDYYCVIIVAVVMLVLMEASLRLFYYVMLGREAYAVESYINSESCGVYRGSWGNKLGFNSKQENSLLKARKEDVKILVISGSPYLTCSDTLKLNLGL